jgi:hypothetical protein
VKEYQHHDHLLSFCDLLVLPSRIHVFLSLIECNLSRLKTAKNLKKSFRGLIDLNRAFLCLLRQHPRYFFLFSQHVWLVNTNELVTGIPWGQSFLVYLYCNRLYSFIWCLVSWVTSLCIFFFLFFHIFSVTQENV